MKDHFAAQTAKLEQMTPEEREAYAESSQMEFDRLKKHLLEYFSKQEPPKDQTDQTE